VLGAGGVEVFPGGLEVRGDLAGLVDVDAVLARLDPLLSRLQVGVDGHAIRSLCKGSVTDGVPVRIFELRRGGACALRQRRAGGQSQQQCPEHPK
jgi:hypothetical protein